MKVTLIAVPSLVSNVPEVTKDARSDQFVGSDELKIIELAGRECYDSFGIGRSSKDFHEHLLDVGHDSVLEHVQYTFRISGISRGLSHELVRHRVGVAISQRSTRYVDESESDVVLHPLYKKYCNDPEDKERLNTTLTANRVMYKAVYQKISEGLIADGVDKTTARKQARGAARNFLENGLETSMVWSANIRTLRHVIKMRGSPAADAEIQLFAKHLHDIMMAIIPEYFSDLTVELKVIE